MDYLYSGAGLNQKERKELQDKLLQRMKPLQQALYLKELPPHAREAARMSIMNEEEREVTAFA